MKKSEIKVGGKYTAKVSGKLTTVRVDAIWESFRTNLNGRYVYDVTNLTTGRKITFRSTAKFRGEAKEKPLTATKVQEMFAAKDRATDNEVARMAGDFNKVLNYVESDASYRPDDFLPDLPSS